jgi:hypothetical protein
MMFIRTYRIGSVNPAKRKQAGNSRRFAQARIALDAWPHYLRKSALSGKLARDSSGKIVNCVH